MIAHARWSIGATRAISVDPDIFTEVLFARDEDMWHVVEEVEFRIAIENTLNCL